MVDQLLDKAMSEGFPELVGEGKFTNNESLKLCTETLMDLMVGDKSEDGLFTLVENVYCGLWRWGTKWQLVIKDFAGNLWAVDYRESSTEEYYNSLSEYTEHELYPVDAVETKVYRYVRT